MLPPGKDWLSTYLEYTAPHEAPEVFHRWIGISTIQAMLGRRVYFGWNIEWNEAEVFTVYPYSYIIILATSGLCRKTTAMSIAEKLLNLTEAPPIICSELMTKESFIKLLSEIPGERSEIYLLSPELTVTLSIDSVKSGMIQLLTRLFDGPDEFTKTTISRGKETIKNVCVNFLGGSTPEEFKKLLPEAALTGGFMSRILLVYGSVPRQRNATPVLNKLLRDELVEGLNAISGMSGVMTFSPEAEKTYVEWYNNLPVDPKPELDGYLSRKHIHVLKTCIALAASRYSMAIEKDLLETAIIFVNDLEGSQDDAVKMLQTNEQGSLLDRVLASIKRAGSEGRTRTDLMRNFSHYANAITLNEVLNTLFLSDQITSTQTPRGGSKYVYRETRQQPKECS